MYPGQCSSHLLSNQLAIDVRHLQTRRTASTVEAGWSGVPVLSGLSVTAVVEVLNERTPSAWQSEVFLALAARAAHEPAAATLCVHGMFSTLVGCVRRFGGDIGDLVSETMFVLAGLAVRPPEPGKDAMLVAAGRVARRAQQWRTRTRPQGMCLGDFDPDRHTDRRQADMVERTVLARLELQELAASADPRHWRTIVALQLSDNALSATERSHVLRARRHLKTIRTVDVAAA